MTNRSKFLLLYGTIFVFFAVPFVIHLIQVGTAYTQISQRENSEYDRFSKLESSLKTSFLKNYPKQEFMFSDNYSIEKSYSYRDTVLSFFIYNTTLRIRSIDLNYAHCLSSKAESEARKNTSDKKYFTLLSALEKTHGPIAREWAEKLGKNRFVNWTKGNECGKYYTETDYYTIDELAFKDFDEFLYQYELEESRVQHEESLILERYNERLVDLRKNLSQKEQRILDEQLSRNPALHDGNKRFSYRGNNLGEFEYTIPTQIIDEEIIEDALELAFIEHYKDFSLAHGSMPYAYCYGNANSGASKVTVNAGNSDVLVMIKNQSTVVRHVYVGANRTFSLNVPNGHYYVHFYYGTGWNPKKKMKNASCGPIVGGFIYYESLDKDPERLSLFNKGMTYTLKTLVGGNFSTVPSSISEAF